MQGVPQVTGGVNPIVTNLFIDFQQKEEQYAGSRIFPFSKSDGDTGTLYADDAENAHRYEDPAMGRNKGATVVDVRLGSKTFSVHPRAFKTLVTASDRRNFRGPLALENFVTRKLMGKFLLAKEVKAEATLRPSANIQSQAAAAAWNNVSLDPIKDGQTVTDLINKAVMAMPTTVLIPPAVWSARIMTNAANTFGKQMRDQMGYMKDVAGVRITPAFVADWLGFPEVIVPQAVKAGGNESTTLQTGGLTGNQLGTFIWSDTTQVYFLVREANPSVGSNAYGISPGPEPVRADGPHFEWDIGGGGDWFRAMAVEGEFELVPKAACKLTGV